MKLILNQVMFQVQRINIIRQIKKRKRNTERVLSLEDNLSNDTQIKNLGTYIQLRISQR